ncbi:nuclear poly(A) polymerase 3-like [Zingiber officinale]|uniref:nuclear poly(A) polymerase 3-like n=1 Tax=Zingiber officinale TaxID=94328 RepID=UPI001C4C3B1B|nr:nuclear poly(A) polymerase 3-like [Zingiber officinale]
MAYASSDDRKIVSPRWNSKPLAHLIEPRTLILPPPAHPPVGYLIALGPSLRADPDGAVFLRKQALVPVNPKVVPPPVVLRLNPAFLAQMDEKRTGSLLKFMGDESLYPSPEEEVNRKIVINQLKQIVREWIKKIAWQHRLPKTVIYQTSATVLTYGSYGLGVHGPESDIDALCVGPYFATMEEDFFIVLRSMLEGRVEVTELQCVKSAKVPLMRFKFNGISIDFPYARLYVVSAPECLNIFDPSILAKIDETSWRSLSGVRANNRILQLVPNLKNFQSLLRCVKLWAKRRGVYSHLFGFFGGIHLAILAAYVCQKYQHASISALLCLFFETFSKWPWPEPVILRDPLIQFGHPDMPSFMPIMMPCSPFDWCNSNITRSTYTKIVSEFQRGYSLTRLQDPEGLKFKWESLFEAYPYKTEYTHFMRIFLAARDVNLQDWAGWVKSRIRALLLKLEMVIKYCDPNPTEFVDHVVAEPNVVFYWGLSPDGETIDIDWLKEEFMKSVNTDHLPDVNHNLCKLDLELVHSSQLPKGLDFDAGSARWSKPHWRIRDNRESRIPLYSQHLPHYFVGHAADGEYPAAAAG